MPKLSGPVTVTFTAPVECAGVVAVMEVSLTTAKPVAGVPPKVTAVTPVKSAPVIITEVPPASGRWLGDARTYRWRNVGELTGRTGRAGAARRRDSDVAHTRRMRW